ncbi:MAG TPA: hypothetical protein PLC99_25405, partial [Verrucomicrobiota bacterium]|nr:hypothetical protein [Verrucomicrobiota bacterium]
YQNTTAIPTAGDFSSTLVHTDTTGGIGYGVFTQAPNGNMIYANGPETLIWGGSEIPATAFIASATSLSGTNTLLTNPTEYTDQVTNTRQTAGQVALIGGGIDTYTKLLLHGNGTDASTTITASETTAHTVTAYGDAQIDTSQYKFGTGSILFDGTGDYIGTADSADWNFGTAEFAVDFWVRFGALPAAGQAMVLYSQRSDADNGVSFTLRNDAGQLSYSLFTCSAGTCAAVGAPMTWDTDVSVNTWYHVALSRQEAGAADYFSVWQDGNRLGPLLDNTTYPDVGGSLLIGGITGALTDGPTHIALNGRLDEFRISKGIRRWAYNADFTPLAVPYRSAANHWIVGFPRPIQGVKFYVSDANTSASSMTAEEWNGVSWANLSITDNTASGGASLAKTGTVTFSSSVNRAKPRYIGGYSLYWYQFHISDGMASIYYCTGDAPIQAIRNVWSGREGYASKVLKYATDYKESTDSLNDDVEATVMDLSSMANTGYVVAGFTSPQQALHVYMEPDNGNSTASNALTLSYWDGQAWAAVSGLSDGTATSDKGLNKSGVISWNPPGAGVEFTVAIGDDAPLYYYKLAWANTLDSTTKMSELRGIESPAELGTYRYATMYQNRALLMNEYNGHRNKIIYSMENAPDIFNGSDSGTFYVGDETDITAAVSVYNIFANTAYDQLIVGKESEIWRLAGDDAENWTMKRIS